MSCGLPMSVAAAPMLLAIASAIRNGTGLSRWRSSADADNGREDEADDVVIQERRETRRSPASARAEIARGGRGARTMPPATWSKKPDSRSCAEMTKNPNSSRIVGQLTKPTTSAVESPEKIIIAIAPSSAMPVAVELQPGHVPDRNAEIRGGEDRDDGWRVHGCATCRLPEPPSCRRTTGGRERAV